jgi:hypothetical protein
MLTNLLLIIEKISIKIVYYTINWKAYLLLESTILDNRATFYLVNNIKLIKLQTSYTKYYKSKTYFN